MPLVGFSQTTKPITGFLGIKLGSNKIAVITAMRARGAKLVGNEKNHVTFSNVKLGQNDVVLLLVNFVNNKAFQAVFMIKPDVEGHTLDVYNNLVDDYTNVYGTGKVVKDYTSPYEEGDGNTYLGLSSGKIKFNTTWYDVNNNGIVININPVDGDLYVGVSYINNVLSNENDKLQEEQNKSDL